MQSLSLSLLSVSRWTRRCLLALALPLLAGAAFAQAYPSKVIKLVRDKGISSE